MRISSSLLLVLAAITAANAANVASVAPRSEPSSPPFNRRQEVDEKWAIIKTRRAEPSPHISIPKHLADAQVDALDAASVNAAPEELGHLDRLASASTRRRHLAHASALNAVHVNVGQVDIKHLASVVHTLSASLESDTKTADHILQEKDHKKARSHAEKLLSKIKVDLQHANTDIGKLSKEAGQKRALLSGLGVDLAQLTQIVDSKNIVGTQSLVTRLSSLKVDSVLQGDVFSVLTDLDVLKTVQSVTGIDTVLTSLLSVPDSVALLDNLKQLDDPECFVSSLVDIPDLEALVGAAPNGLTSIASLSGTNKLMSYVNKYGYTTVGRVLNTAGVPCVLESLVKVPGSVKLLRSIKSVADVNSLVSGINVIGVMDFVKSIQAVDNVDALVSTVKSVAGGELKKRAELLDGVESTLSGVTSGLPLGEILKIKRAIAHIDALPASVDVDVKHRRDLIQDLGVDQALNNLDVAKIASLKRSIADLSAVSTEEVTNIIGSVVKRDGIVGGVVGGLEGGVGDVVAFVDGSVVGGVEHISKRDLPVDQVLDAVDLNRILALRRSAVLDTLPSISSLDLNHILPAVQRAISNADSITKSVSRRDATSLTLLSDSLDTLTSSVSILLPKLVKVSDAVHDEAVTKEIKTEVIPMVAKVGGSLDKVVKVQAPQLEKQTGKVVATADKASKSIP
ncbi:hypothetical protein PHSY_005246 [Pseudozyma hubeiensis SY62]|uniref:Uncharacterized protein n=1 Tax=Pseudozyma hubeiensis (strain SY62) TaxID=1305764 RepID=R9PHS2_PSEHS|nr:hypothetical protein PHSY_005246 [Pseudozyma hubeiensis SY62]GAC97660.1 hypothetical protein PHSY_005246 [Pseudozyma hubeiensis SY62]